MRRALSIAVAAASAVAVLADRCWADDDLDQLETVPGSAFEAVVPTGR